MGEKDDHWKQLRDIPVPDEYQWIWKHFLMIWNHCEYDFNGNVIFTYRTINDYVDCMNVRFDREDIKCLLKIKCWALEIISEVRKKED